MLLIDSGNSALKTRLLQDGKRDDRIFHLRDGCEGSGFAGYLASLDLDLVCSASVASTDIQQTLAACVSRHQPRAEHRVLTTLPRLGSLTNGYRDYTRLGVDRWLTLVAAQAMLQQDAIIVDAGSAITIDLLSIAGGHLGGAILPGFNTGIERFRGLFPAVDFNDPAIRLNHGPGRSTAECIHLPQERETAVEVRTILDDWIPLLTPPVALLLTGQDAGRIAESLHLPYRLIPDLVFNGMLKQIELLG